MRFAKKMKILIISILFLITAMCGILGISPWVCEPRDFIKEDEILMAFHPVNCSILSIIAFILWVFAMKFGIKVFKFFNELDKHLKSNSENNGKSYHV